MLHYCRASFVAFSFLLFFLNGISQTAHKDTILLINGTSVISTIVDTANGLTTFINPKKPKKERSIENDRIFSITSPSGERLVYVYDTLMGNEFTVDEMRYFIYGEQDAHKGYKANTYLYVGVAVGILSGLTGQFWSPIPPFAFTALSGIPKVKIRKETVSNPDYLNHDTYVMGYDRIAKKKRRIKSLIGGGAGLVVGLATFNILVANGYNTFK